MENEIFVFWRGMWWHAYVWDDGYLEWIWCQSTVGMRDDAGSDERR